MDKNPEIIAWGSETAVIPYFCNAEGKKRRYYMDIWMKDASGQEFFVEIKPKKETQPPIKPANLTTAAKKRYMNEIYTWSVNCDKWKAASAVAEKRNIKFRVLTEDGLRKLGYKG